MKRFPGIMVTAIVALVVCTFPVAGHAAPASSNGVLDWNVTALKAIVAEKQDPFTSMRTIALVHVGIYDAVEAVTTTSSTHSYTLNGKSLHGIDPNASLEGATAAAARTVLLGLTPGQRTDIEAAYASSMAAIPDSPAKSEGVLVGTWIGTNVLAWRSRDHTDLAVPYVQPTHVGIFQPVAPATAVFTQLPYVQPITLRSASQFRPGPPPALTSAQFAADYNEVKSLGALNSTTRTADQTQIALFWLGDDSYMWDVVARSLAAQQHLTLEQDARLFAEMNVAMLDGLTAVFDAKYLYNFWRPQAAIRSGDLDGNPATVGDPSWTSLRPAPPHPDYPAAHPTSAGAASTVLASVFGNATSFSFTTLTAPDNAVRSYTSFSQAAEEEAASRVYVGFHFRTSVNTGLKLGRQVGSWAIDHFGSVIPAPSNP